MSKRKNNRKIQTVPTEHQVDPILQLNIYYVRMHDANAELTLMMKFEDGTIILLDDTLRICDTSSLSPFIYLRTLDVRMGKRELYWQLPEGQKMLRNHRLEMSYRRSIYGQQNLEELGTQSHSLKNYFYQQHCFHFGIRFSSKFNFFVPGKSFMSRWQR
jgi:hypothetical protein